MDYQPRSTPFHKSLIEVKTIAGVESRLFIFNTALVVAMAMTLESVWFLGFGFITHLFFRWLTKSDPHKVKVYMRFNRQAEVYDPWPRAGQKINKRPKGFGQAALK